MMEYKEYKEYNSEITVHEVKHALQQLKSSGAPGPDGVLPVFLKKGGHALPETLRCIFQYCWSQGKVPACYKKDSRIYIPQPGKPHYHTEKSYRSLSLNAVVGKVYERIIALRFVWFLESTFSIDLDQFAYLRNRSIVQALLSQAKKGFRDNEHTVAAFIDLEGAFDGVWRNDLLQQLDECGIQGRLFLYVADFLHGRQSRSLVNSTQTDWINICYSYST